MPEKETTVPKDEEAKEISNEETLSQIFTSMDNGLVDEEELNQGKVHMFH